jgi:SAM-dependent methyltransferase
VPFIAAPALPKKDSVRKQIRMQPVYRKHLPGAPRGFPLPTPNFRLKKTGQEGRRAMDNEEFWSSRKRAIGYADRADLYPPEAKFIDEFRDKMGAWRMFDLGIGGGRSTIHFAPLVAEYVGTEYADVMLQECITRVRDLKLSANPLTLALADVRDLSAYRAQEFDFVLFSANGLDEIDHEGRLQALAEIHRVLKPGGVYLFSSHNLLAANNLFKFHFAKNPIRLSKAIWRFVRIRGANRDLRRKGLPRDYTLIHDYVFDWKKFSYYIDPDVQLAQLGAAGFHDARVYLASGRENLEAEARKTDPWLHYICYA